MELIKTKEELWETFTRKIKYLKSLVDEVNNLEYDFDMRIEKCNSIAGILRAVLIDGPSKKMISLVKQIDIKNLLYFNYRKHILSSDNNLYPESSITTIEIKDSKVIFRPKFITDNSVFLSFDNWLDEIVLDDKCESDNLVSRKEIIRAIADKEEAHIDPDYDAKFRKIGLGNKLNVKFLHKNEIIFPENNIYYECIVAIASEFISAYDLYELIKDYEKTTYLNDLRFLAKEINNYYVGYRYYIWQNGDKTTGNATLNLLVFKSNNIVNDYFLGISKRIEFQKKNDRPITIHLVDFNNFTEKIKVINKDNNQILVATKKDKKNFVILNGSFVSKKSNIDKKYYAFPDKSQMIKKDLLVSKDSLLLCIDSNDIEFDN